MATLSLRIYVADSDVTKTMQFDPSTSIYDTCKIIRDKVLEAGRGDPKEYGLFLPDDDAKKGVWLEPGRSLEYYILRNGDLLEYRKKLRTLRVQMLDGTLKTMMIDDSQPVANLMVVICTKIGITNHDEYGLVRENAEDETDKIPNNYGTLTLRRKREEKERDAKMDQLRKKLKTDDELNWVDPAKTLREQGIDEGESVLLRRKFFFSDGNIDSHDPVQLNLLYVQARDAILDGTHPVTEELACQLAGIQVHIQFGNHNEAKHKPPFLDLKEFLPHSYVKMKGIEKKIFQEHKQHYGLSELDAKVLYTKTCRSLPTYGVTFFLVKEKMKGKNKLVPRLLGVTKDSVLRLDERTKEILKTWPLTTVRRWGASPNTFTLDFGDYSDQYYSVQTREGEQIVQLISGYIDIIMKRKKAKDHFGIEGDEGSTMIEDSVSPSKASILQQHESNKGGKVTTESVAKPAVIRRGTDGSKQYGLGYMANAQYTTVSGQINMGHSPPVITQQSKVLDVITEPKKAFLSTISSSQETIRTVESELMSKASIPELGTDVASMKWKETTFDTNRQNVSSQIAAMNAATAQIINLTTTKEVDYNEVGAAITSITSNLPEMGQGVRMMAALTGTGDELLDAARKLCTAFTDLLNAVQTNASRQNLLNAASRVGEASEYVLHEIRTEEKDDESKEVLLNLAKAVANATAVLVIKAKSVASTVSTNDQQPLVIGAATECALATSQLVACTKVVAATVDNPTCRDQLTAAAVEVAHAVENLVSVCADSVPDRNTELMKELDSAASDVTGSLTRLLSHISVKETTTEYEETILVSSERILSSSNDTGEMLKQARILGQATAQLIQAIKGDAEKETDSEVQRNLLTAAKDLAEATARMVEAARLCASNPNVETQNELRQTVEELRAAANPTLRNKLTYRLKNAAKYACSTGNQCIVSSQAVSRYNVNKLSQDELLSDCKVLADQIPAVIKSIKTTPNDGNAEAQVELINVCEQFVPAGTRLIQSGRAVLPTISHEASTLQLSQSIQHFTTALNDLRSVTARTREVMEHPETGSFTSIRSFRHELTSLYRAIDTTGLRALPGETAQSASEEVCASVKTLNQITTQLVSSSLQGNDSYTEMATRDFVSSLSNLTSGVRGVVATSSDKSMQQKIIEKTEDVVDKGELLIEKSQTKPVKADQLHQAAKEVSLALRDVLNCLPLQNEIDETIMWISTTSEVLTRDFPRTSKSYVELQRELNYAASRLNEASTNVISSVENPSQLANSSKDFGSAFHDLLNVGSEVIGQTSNADSRSQVISSLKNVSVVSSNLLHVAKTVSADPVANRNQLTTAARAVTDSINNLINVCTSASPSQKECDNAVRNIQAMRPLLYRPSEPVNDASYYDCLDTIMEKSTHLGDGMTGIANHAKRSEHEQFSASVQTVSNAICGLTEAAVQSAYLIAVSDLSSSVGQRGLIDQSQFARAHTIIEQACNTLISPVSNQQQVLSAATTIAKYTSSLCNASRVASSKTTNPVAKRQFVQSAKEVANCTANLVKEIKALDVNYSEDNRRNCSLATDSLLDSLNSLITFASSPEFVSKPARISETAYIAQEPILSAGDSILTASCEMIKTAKLLIVTPKDPSTWQFLADRSKQVSDSIKKLVLSVKDNAPGQKECESVIRAIESQLKEIDQVSLAAISEKFAPRKNKTLEGFLEQTETSTNEILNRLEPLREAAKFKAENIGHIVHQLSLYFESLVSGSIGAASNIVYSKQQMNVLDQTKTVAECLLQLVYCAKQSGGNPKAKGIHPEVDDAVESTRETLSELTGSLEQYTGIVNAMIQNITQAMQRIPDSRRYGSIVIDSMDPDVDYHARMVNTAKEIAVVAQEIVNKPWNNEGSILGIDLSRNYSQLAADCVCSISLDSNPDTYSKLCNSIHDLGSACVNAVTIASAPTNYSNSSKDRNDAAKTVSERVSHVLSALQASSRGTQACLNAASTVSGIIGDLDTIIMFATAGTLHAEKENETFTDHRENILKTAKALVEDTKTLVAGAASSQEQLAVAAQNAVSTIVQLSEVVKCGAASLGSDNPESQVMLINAIKDVANALGDLIQATKSASGKGVSDPSMSELKDSARVMVTNVTSLLKTVKVVEDEHSRGTRALEAAIEAIGVQEIRALSLPSSNSGGSGKAGTPEELIRSTKAITLATAKAVAAGNSCRQEDVIIAANMGRKAISDMLAICKSCSTNTEVEDLKRKVLDVGKETALQYRELLQAVLNILRPNQTVTDPKQTLAQISRKIAQCVTELVSVAESLKGNDWVDPDDPTMIAENELLGAAASIDAAAKKLASLRPRRSIQETDESLNFDEMILEAAKSIAAATSALVKAASAAQRELVDNGKMSRTPLTSSDDGQWSEGLISAARLVAVATHSLVESANSLVQGISSEEKLISSAKQVASSTAQLLVACKVKADPDSETTKRLQAAGNAVKRATDNLVRAAQQAIQHDEERSLILNKRMVGGIAQEINARSEVLRIERELEEARSRLTAIRQAKYNKSPKGDDHNSYDEADSFDSYTA